MNSVIIKVQDEDQNVLIMQVSAKDEVGSLAPFVHEVVKSHKYDMGVLADHLISTFDRAMPIIRVLSPAYSVVHERIADEVFAVWRARDGITYMRYDRGSTVVFCRPVDEVTKDDLNA